MKRDFLLCSVLPLVEMNHVFRHLSIKSQLLKLLEQFSLHETLEIRMHQSLSPQTTEELRIHGAIEKKPRFGMLSRLSWFRFQGDENGYLVTIAKNPSQKNTDDTLLKTPKGKEQLFSSFLK